MEDDLRYRVETTAGTDGVLWRAEVTSDGRLVDATRWTPRPRQAIGDMLLLRQGRYWASDSQPRYSTAA